MKIALTIASVMLLSVAAQADGPATPEMEPFAPLIGTWDCKTSFPNEDGTTTEGQAVWTFWWILDGRAIMDEWRSPKPDGSGDFTGVNIRQWNLKTESYEAAWLPSNSLAWDMYACEWIDGSFVMERDGVSPAGQAGRSRITFHDITPTSFQWHMDWSSDQGETWNANVFVIEGTRRD